MASFTQNMRMAQLYPTDNRGGVDNSGPSVWDEFSSKVIPAMQRKRQEEQRMMEYNDLRRKNIAEGRAPYDNSFSSGGGALHQIGQQVAQQRAPGRAGDPNAPNSMLESFDKRHDKETAQKIAERAISLKERTQDENLGFKYDKQNEDIALKNRIAGMKMPEEQKLRMMQQFGLAKIDETGAQARQTEGVRQTGRIALGDQRGTQQQANIKATGVQQRLTQDERAGDARSLAELQGQIKANNANTGISPYQQNIGLNNNAKKLFDQNPQWQKYIIRDEKGGFNIVPPGTSGMDEMTHKLITDAIYGGTAKDIKLPKDDGTTPVTVDPTTMTPTKPAPVSKYKVTVR